MDEDIKSKIGEYFYRSMNLNEKSNYTIEDIHAKDLFCSERLDLIVKYMYIDSMMSGHSKDNTYVSRLYMEHLKALNEGIISEPGNPEKNSLNDYVDTFKKLYIDILNNGFNTDKSIIPMGENKVIIDGGHRVAISALLNRYVTVARFENIEEPNYNYHFFAERGMRTDHIESMVLNYVELSKKQNTYVCCIWPIAGKQHQEKKIKELINNYGKIIYRKKCRLTQCGLKNFQILAYSHQDWVGNPDNGYEGVDSKVNMCFSDADTIFYIIEGGQVEDMLQLKEHIRDIFNIGKHSVHITDNYDESIVLLRAILNMNSLWVMNNFNVYSDSKLMKAINNLQVNENEVLSPEYTLAFFGKINVDEIHKEKVVQPAIDFTYDYSNFFWYANKKFLTPRAAKLFLTDETELFDSIGFLSDINRNNNVDKAYMAIYKYKIRKNIIDVLNKLGLFDIVYKMYKKIKGV